MTDHASALVDRYIHAVRRLLPRSQREDIALELRGILESQMDDRETQLQHPLSDEDVREILKDFGNPRAVAANYGSRQYLIGPDVFPSYVAAIKICLPIIGVVGLFMVAMAATTVDEGRAEAILRSAWAALSMGLLNLGIMTLVFATAGHALPWLHSRKWDPEDLPDPDPPLQRSDVLGSMLGSVLMLCWWLGINGIVMRWLEIDMPFVWAEVWTQLHAVVVVVILACIAREVLALAQPHWTRLYTGAGVFLDLFILAIFVRFLAAGAYVSPASGSGGLLVAMTNKVVFMALLIGAVGTAVSIVTGTVRYWRLSRLNVSGAASRYSGPAA